MRTYKVARGPHYDADKTQYPNLTNNSFYTLFPVKGIMSCKQIIPSHIYIR